MVRHSRERMLSPRAVSLPFWLLLGSLAAAPALSQPAPAPAQPVPNPAPQQPPRPTTCDNNCIRASADRAVPACAPRIERESPGDYDWIFRPYGTIFQEADTPEQNTPTVVRYRGDSIRFLSPQKEWTRVVYECGFDAASGQVAYVRVRLGVLGKTSAIPQLPPPPVAPGRPGPNSPPPPAVSPQVAAPQNVPPGAMPGGPPVQTLNKARIGEPSQVEIFQQPERPARR